MLLEQAKQIGGVLVDYNILAWDVNAETVRRKVLSVLEDLQSAP
jgi:hypothetical protein